jgi:hypothetical protein
VRHFSSKKSLSVYPRQNSALVQSLFLPPPNKKQSLRLPLILFQSTTGTATHGRTSSSSAPPEPSIPFCLIMAAPAPVAVVPFVGHDNMDEGANNQADVLVPPQVHRRYDQNQKFCLLGLTLPLRIRRHHTRLDDVRERLNAEYVCAPNALAALIPQDDGQDPHRCCFRVPRSNTLSTLVLGGWSQEDRPKEGDIFVSGRRNCIPLDQLGFAMYFLQTPAPRYFYVARPFNRLGQDTLDALEADELEEVEVAPNVVYLRRVEE